MIARISLGQRSALFYPIPPVPRCAVLVRGFQSRFPVRVFSRGWTEAAAKFAPQAIAATLPQLEALAGTVHLTHAVIVFRKDSEPRLKPDERERLWRAFRVPVFEQVIAPDGAVLAAECEAHSGLHIESPKLAVGDREVDRSACGCGRTTPRLMDVERLHALRSVAAYAR